MNKHSVIFSVLFLLFLQGLKAQVTIKDFEWKTSTALTEIPDSLKNEDAIMITYDHSISNALVDQYRQRYQSVIWYYVRIRFLTNAGVDQFTKFFLSRSKNESFEILDARTIKPGNVTVDLTDNDLNQAKLSYKIKGTDDIDQDVSFSMPGVEAGDEVEFCYKLVSGYIKSGKDIYLFTHLPCLHSTFSYKVDKNIHAEVKDLSTMPAPKVEQNSEETIYRWEMKNIPALGGQENSIPALTMPYVSIVIRMVQVLYAPNLVHDQDISPATWEGVYEAIDNELGLLDQISKDDSTEFAKFIYDKAGGPVADSDSVYTQFCRFNKYINDSISMAGWNETVNNKPLLYYLQNHKIDRWHLIALYRKFFIMTGMKYYMGFGRNKYEGLLDAAVAIPHHISDFLFAVKDTADNIRLFMLNTPEKIYYLDEIPNYLEGTKVLLTGKSQEDEKKIKTIQLKIPTSSPQVNFHNEKMKIDVSFSKEDDSYDLRDYYSGSLSTEYRFDLSELLREKNYAEALMRYFPDSKSDSTIVMENSTSYPFPVSFNYFFKCPRLLTEIMDSIYTIPLKKLLHFSVIGSSDKPRTMDYYTERKYHHRCDYQVQFDKPMELLNSEKLSFSKENMFGAFECKVQKISNTSLLIHLDYTVSSFLLPKDHYKDIKELETAFEKFNNSSVIVKKL